MHFVIYVTYPGDDLGVFLSHAQNDDFGEILVLLGQQRDDLVVVLEVELLLEAEGDKVEQALGVLLTVYQILFESFVFLNFLVLVGLFFLNNLFKFFERKVQDVSEEVVHFLVVPSDELGFVFLG